ncbi:MAG: hypothetical protein HY901_18545 [Deltaproteobacteria bacterium]|nr:hypothetical protein [Deltaproteobacteria bacterium]
MSELSPQARALLDAGRRESAPTEADRERLRQALCATLGPLPAPDATSTRAMEPAASALPPGAAPVSWAVKLVVAVALGGVGLGSWALWGPSSDPREQQGEARAPRVLPSPVLPAPRAPPAASPATEAESPTTSATATPPAPSPAPRAARPKAQTFAPLDLTTADHAAQPSEEPGPSPAATAQGTLADELRLLREAQIAAKEGSPRRTLELLDEHARLYPQGALREERTAARIVALCARGRLAEAAEEAEVFLDENPSSPYASKVRDSCALVR